MNRIMVQHYFDSAHRLTNTPDLHSKECSELHGHTYAVRVHAHTNDLNKAGKSVDFKLIKNRINKLDHRYINEVFIEEEIDLEPTAENIAKVIAEWCFDLNVKIERVELCQSYRGEENSSWVVYVP